MVKKWFFLMFLYASIIWSQSNTLPTVTNFDEFIKLAEKGKWIEARNTNDIQISYRSLSLNKNIKTREMRISLAITPCELDSIIKYIKTPNLIKQWNKSVRKVKLLENNPNNWIIHTTYKIPFPFAQQDLVASYHLKRDTDSFTLLSESIPDYIPVKKGITREGYNLSKWYINNSNNEKTTITFSVISLSNSSIPRFIKDAIIQRKLLNSFINLKESLL